MEAATTFSKEFGRAVQRVLKRSFPLHLTDQDKLRLLNLKIPTIVHHIPLDEVVEILAYVYPPRTDPGFTLGWRIANIAGPMALRRISDEVARRYPNAENIKAWQSTERLIQIEALEDQNESPETIQDYLRDLRRTRITREKARRVLSRRKYRNSPW